MQCAATFQRLSPRPAALAFQVPQARSSIQLPQSHSQSQLCSTRSLSSSSSSSSSTSSTSSTPPPPSSRSTLSLTLLPSYLQGTPPPPSAKNLHPFHPTFNPTGFINLSVAENRISPQIWVDKIQSLLKSDSSTLFSNDDIYYQNTQGVLSCRSAISTFLTRTFLNNVPYKINPDHIVISSGCNASLENCFFTLTEAGDTVLTPSPYYATFQYDLGAKIGLSVVGLNLPPIEENSVNSDANGFPIDSYYYPTLDTLNSSYDAVVKATGKPPKVLLIANPSNPLAQAYPVEVLDLMLEWTISKNMSIVSDEIYGNSDHGVSRLNDGSVHEVPFTSLAHLSIKKYDKLHPSLHVIAALSKDLTLSGLRFGITYTENEGILPALRKINDLTQVSSVTQNLVMKMLSDENEKGEGLWIESAIDESNAGIGKRYSELTAVLDEVGIKYVKSRFGMFLMVNMRPIMNKDESEVQFSKRLKEEDGITFTPGGSMGLERGLFRVVFTACSGEAWGVAVERIRTLKGGER